MKSIGLLGGMSWESSLEYYRIVNQLVKDQLGDLHSARVVMVSVDFAPIAELMQAERWSGVADHLIEGARQVEAGGADFLLIATNTMHSLYDQIEAAVGIPLIHIADAAGEEIQKHTLRKVGLLGTIFTMEKDFYRGRLAERYGLEVIIPDKADRWEVNRIIFDELVVGEIREDSKAFYLSVIRQLVAQGAEGIVLGCTEIPMLVSQGDVAVPVFDTTYIHARAAVDMALTE